MVEPARGSLSAPGLPAFCLSPGSLAATRGATEVSSGGFMANWGSISKAVGYRLDVSSNAFESYVSGCLNLDVGSATNRAVSSLSADTTYYYRVRAYNTEGTSKDSGTILVTTSQATRPTLGHTRDGNNLVLSWSTNAIGFTLNHATSLLSVDWRTSSPAPVVLGGNYVVTNAMADGAKFYRLEKP